MIDPTQLPILLKAIDFVFEEGRKILEERRERRKANATPPDGKSEEPAEETALAQALDPVSDAGLKSALLRLGRAVAQG